MSTHPTHHAGQRTLPLRGRRAFVTGGSRGIGAGIVRRLTTDGATVAFTYRGSREAAMALSDEVGGAHAAQADSGDAETLRQAIAESAAWLGGVDVLVNNAAVAHVAPVDELSLEQFDQMVSVNIRGVFVAIQAVLPHMSTGGRIINIGSINADRVPMPGLSAYAMTKAAVAGLTRGAARDLGPRGITVNNIQAGPTDTDMNPESGPAADENRHIMPVGRYADASDIADVVAHLAREESWYTTGASWAVDGGYGI
jgi:3-oxoacyl-[acyl-carrier protein] reductase